MTQAELIYKFLHREGGRADAANLWMNGDRLVSGPGNVLLAVWGDWGEGVTLLLNSNPAETHARKQMDKLIDSIHGANHFAKPDEPEVKFCKLPFFRLDDMQKDWSSDLRLGPAFRHQVQEREWISGATASQGRLGGGTPQKKLVWKDRERRLIFICGKAFLHDPKEPYGKEFLYLSEVEVAELYLHGDAWQRARTASLRTERALAFGCPPETVPALEPLGPFLVYLNWSPEHGGRRAWGTASHGAGVRKFIDPVAQAQQHAGGVRVFDLDENVEAEVRVTVSVYTHVTRPGSGYDSIT